MIFGKVKIIDSCDKCKLNIFIDCIVRNDYSGLAISGKPKPAELIEAWDIIYNEYMKLSENATHKRILECYKDIADLKTKIYAIELGLYILLHKYSPEIVHNFKRLGFEFEFNHNDLDQYVKDIEKARRFLGNDKMELKLKEIQMDRMVKENSAKPLTDSDFDKILTQLSKYQGYRLDKNQITVSEFVSVQTTMRKDIEAQQRSIENLNKK